MPPNSEYTLQVQVHLFGHDLKKRKYPRLTMALMGFKSFEDKILSVQNARRLPGKQDYFHWKLKVTATAFT